MKKKLIDLPSRSTIAVPLEMKSEFRKICIMQDLKPSDVVKKLLGNWIEKEKKKQNVSLVANG